MRLEGREGVPPTETVQLEYCESDKMAADIFSKPFVHADRWKSVCGLIGIDVVHKAPFWRREPAKRAAGGG